MDQKAAPWSLKWGGASARELRRELGQSWSPELSPGVALQTTRNCTLFLPPEDQYLSKKELHRSQTQQNLLPADSDIILQTGMSTVCPAAFLEQGF